MNENSELNSPTTKVLIVGKGFIGSQLSNFLAADENFEVHAVSSEQVNYRDYNLFLDFLTNYNSEGTSFDAIINCSGYTGEKNVDDAEKEKELVWLLNSVLPTTLASAAQANNIPSFVNISSGCIFTGYNDDKSGYDEEVVPNFGLFEPDSSWYSKTKHAGELSLTSSFNCYNLRIRMPFGEIYHPKNVISKMLGYTKILTQPNSLTYLYDLFNFVYNMLIQPPPFGIYNVVSSGDFSSKELFEVFDDNKEQLIENNLLPKDWKLHDITFYSEEQFYKENITVAKRSNCILSNKVASDLNLHKFTTVDKEFLDKTVKSYIADKKGQEESIIQLGDKDI
ncbi:MAG TPA: hypothetical protein DCS66_17310 [Flavobacteriaceae bacterium]|nr:hypothetical protein [Flavobacteriaceae bacterium]